MDKRTIFDSTCRAMHSNVRVKIYSEFYSRKRLMNNIGDNPVTATEHDRITTFERS